MPELDNIGDIFFEFGPDLDSLGKLELKSLAKSFHVELGGGESRETLIKLIREVASLNGPDFLELGQGPIEFKEL